MKKILIYCYLIFTVACQNQVQEDNKYTSKYYYNSGELREVRQYDEKNDTTTYYSKAYYKSGELKEQGKVINFEKDGYWEEWYGDNSQKWKGEYEGGKRLIEITSTDSFNIHFEDTMFLVGLPVQIRVSSAFQHPDDIVVGIDNGELNAPIDPELFNHSIVPGKSGYLYIALFAYDNGTFKCVLEDSVSVK